MTAPGQAAEVERGLQQLASEYDKLRRVHEELQSHVPALLDRLAAREREVEELRKLLWLRHGHIGLYGDDGEMQCGMCGIDFKRNDPNEIERVFTEQGRCALERGKP